MRCVRIFAVVLFVGFCLHGEQHGEISLSDLQNINQVSLNNTEESGKSACPAGQTLSSKIWVETLNRGISDYEPFGVSCNVLFQDDNNITPQTIIPYFQPYFQYRQRILDKKLPYLDFSPITSKAGWHKQISQVSSKIDQARFSELISALAALKYGQACDPFQIQIKTSHNEVECLRKSSFFKDTMTKAHFLRDGYCGLTPARRFVGSIIINNQKSFVVEQALSNKEKDDVAVVYPGNKASVNKVGDVRVGFAPSSVLADEQDSSVIDSREQAFFNATSTFGSLNLTTGATPNVTISVRDSSDYSTPVILINQIGGEPQQVKNTKKIASFFKTDPYQQWALIIEFSDATGINEANIIGLAKMNVMNFPLKFKSKNGVYFSEQDVLKNPYIIDLSQDKNIKVVDEVSFEEIWTWASSGFIKTITPNQRETYDSDLDSYYDLFTQFSFLDPDQLALLYENEKIKLLSQAKIRSNMFKGLNYWLSMSYITASAIGQIENILQEPFKPVQDKNVLYFPEIGLYKPVLKLMESDVIKSKEEGGDDE